MSKDYEILAKLIRARDIETFDNNVIYITKKRLNDLIKEVFPYMSTDSLVIKNNHVLNCTLFGKEIELINDETIIVGGYSVGGVKHD